MVNPFDYAGPDFLYFYAMLALFVFLSVYFLNQWRESEVTIPKLNLRDPYEIAYLRGGEREAMRVAVVSLIDRGLLTVNDDELRTKNANLLSQVQRGIERSILSHFIDKGKVAGMFEDASIKTSAMSYEVSLSRHDLLASDSVVRKRYPGFLIGLVILLGASAYKTYLAIERGKNNYQFLIWLTFAGAYFLYRVHTRRRSAAGDQVMKDLKNLFRGLKDRALSIRSGGDTNEAALLAAVFGLNALWAPNFPYITYLFPKSQSVISNSGGGCGSSCGTSCGSSCGSSCGGGCGGGCGGCGG